MNQLMSAHHRGECVKIGNHCHCAKPISRPCMVCKKRKLVMPKYPIISLMPMTQMMYAHGVRMITGYQLLIHFSRKFDTPPEECNTMTFVGASYWDKEEVSA
jgi:hypothetical protein